jgi:hypothetical protein
VIRSQGEFLALVALKRGKVSVSGQDVHIREFNVAERAQFLKLAKDDPVKCQVFVVRSCVTDEAGASLFDDAGAEALAAAAPSTLDVICNAIFKLSGLAEDDSSKNA